MFGDPVGVFRAIHLRFNSRVVGQLATLLYARCCVPSSQSNTYRDCDCKNIEMSGFYHTILKFPELGPDIYLTEQANDGN